MDNGKTALNGLVVLDLTISGPGAYTTMLLADYGGEVILVEPISEASEQSESGKSESHWTLENLFKLFYGAINRNKKSMVINLKTSEGQKIFYKLIEKADVVLEGFRPGVASRMNVDYQTLQKFNPRLIYCSMSGYGQDGPYRDLAGHDVNYIGFAGALDIIGSADGPPIIPMNLLADWGGAGLNAFMGILLAVIAREHTGRGQYIDTSYMESVISLMTFYYYDYMNTGTMYKRGQTWFGGGAPYYNVYEAKDGKYLTVGCLEPKFWQNLCRVLDREDFILYQYDEGQKKEEIFSALKAIFRTKKRDEWFDFLKDKNIPVGKVLSFDEAVVDQQWKRRSIIQEITQPGKGKVRHIRPLIRLSETPGRIKSPAPFRGQHTENLLCEFGYTVRDIEKLRKDGIVE